MRPRFLTLAGLMDHGAGARHPTWVLRLLQWLVLMNTRKLRRRTRLDGWLLWPLAPRPAALALLMNTRKSTPADAAGRVFLGHFAPRPAALALLIASLAVPVPAQQPDVAKLAGVFAAAHRSGNFDGVAVVMVEGKTVLASALGFSDRVAKTPMRSGTIFRLGSLTKQVTALMVMQEVSAGRIGLEQTVGSILGTLPESAGRVTIRQLLSHVSGLPNPSDGPEDKVPPFYLRTAPSAKDLAKSAMSFCAGPPKREPGGQFEYNNCDYIVLGALLESLSGKSYGDLVRERVIRPLGLRSWMIAPADPRRGPAGAGRYTAAGYTSDGSPDPVQNPATYGAAGALLGSALDVAKWNNALIGHRLLSAEATETMFRADPKLQGEALGSWAYDSDVSEAPLHVIERQGDIGSTRLLSLLLPGKKASIVIISNSERADLFQTYSKQGLGYEVLKAWFGGR